MLETFGQVGMMMFSFTFIVMMVMFTAFFIVVMMLAAFVVMVVLVCLNGFGLLWKTENQVFGMGMPDYANTAQNNYSDKHAYQFQPRL